MTGIKKRNTMQQTATEFDPYAHLNLVWKPLIKESLDNVKRF